MIDAWLEAEVELLQRHAQECRLIFGLTEALVVKTCTFMLLTRTKGGKEP
ncbi:hypothetical protein GTE47_004018 [Salmonella enterica subsp. enterica]|uniref:Uncharacterized protein n=2 Tax=Salmonella enterica TaxID=28901 RepID=A0A749FCD7_SALER|nr:hypothetical protein [Salmonella enterica subsp. enterica serovar Ealing]EDP8610606.1 hypothetical protein [Salmonella enterica subsp. enterica serovar Livingstone]EDP8916721.1 hypothetical protein [Salmonella enterica subsp. enterica serovar Chailey]EDP8984197.1 hypothetical protein [Salmonella enterica subsp. enterica]EDQ0490381.1 hypothetical protein [Salmonella enterica subsp. enterica serovar Havana]EDQ1688285.1 hypothetical protein [Salmonella enterica]EDQ4687144.1 hypothetical prote